MLYSILCYDCEDTVFAMSRQEDADLMVRLSEVTRTLESAGRLGPRLRLAPTSAATTLTHKGEVLDGPFAETKEALLGFYILDVASHEEAVEIARRLSREKPSGTYEIRPVNWIDAGSLAG